MKRLRLLLVVAVLLAGAAYGWFRFGARTAPVGQPPLAAMDLAALRDDFNRAAAGPRMIVLLSPT